MDERIKLSPLCDVTKILRLTETEIRFGHDELSVTVQNTTEEDIRLIRYGPIASIEKQQLNK